MQLMNLSSTDCKNCYKCVRTCAVKAIKIQDEKAQIVPELCVGCGHCLVVCPQNARDVQSSLQQVLEAIGEGRKVHVSLAPSYRAYFKASDQFVSALKQIGVARVEETAIGAEYVSEAYEAYIKGTEETALITTCCPSTVALIERYYTALIPHMIPVVSPMVAHGRLIKAATPDSYTVFIGPCVSKIGEALRTSLSGAIDAVLTFDEIITYFEEQGIVYQQLPPQKPDSVGSLRGKKYPVVGGVLSGIRDTIAKKGLQVLRIHGMENCKEVLEVLQAGQLKNVCIEMSICNESCLQGPGGHNQQASVFTRLQTLQKYLHAEQTADQGVAHVATAYPRVALNRTFCNEQVKVQKPSQEAIGTILESMGKNELKDELNCGACGYATCREKAVAVINGMSEIDMCLPYTRSIAERLSNEIFHHSPNAIFILDRACRILDMNPTAECKFGYRADLIKGKSIQIMMPSAPFEAALRDKLSRPKEKVTLKAYDLVAYRDIIYLEKQQAVLVLFTDITQEEKQKQEVMHLKVNTLDVTQSIIDKQMRVAQEIASLLGETTAETKVAIMKLRQVLQEEGE